MVKKGSKKIWMLRRMRQMGVDQRTIAAYWKAEGLCHLEYCSPVYSGALTVEQERDLARVHRRAVAAITGVRTRGGGIQPELSREAEKSQFKTARVLAICRDVSRELHYS